METFVVVSDPHLEDGTDPHPAYKLAKKFIKHFKPNTIYLNGDMLDLSYMSSYTAAAELAREGKKLKKDYDLLSRELDFFQRWSKKVVYLSGNHEERAQRTIDRYMNWGDLLSLPDHTRLKERNIDWYPEKDQPIEITQDLLISHGFYYNMHYAKKTVETTGRSIIVGHTHRRQEYTYSYYGGYVVTCYGLGCLCDLSPDFMKSKNSGHSHGFGVGYITSGGFHFDNILIRNNEFVYGGKLWKL